MMIGDHQLHAREAPGAQAFEERGPERAVFAVADIDTEDLAVAGRGDPSRDHDRPRHHPAPDPALDVRGVAKHVRELDMAERPAPERVEVGVELRADPRHLALGDPRLKAQRPDQVVDLAGAHPVHVGLHHHREQGPVDPAAPLEH